MRVNRVGVLFLVATTFGTLDAEASEPGCFPACRSGFVCSPQGQCVSACNPACAADQRCTDHGQCLDRPGSRGAPLPATKEDRPAPTTSPENVEQEPARRFALTLGVGGQQVLGGTGKWGATPEASFQYTLNPGKMAELFLGFRTRINLEAILPQFGPEVGVRVGVATKTGFVKGGFFVSLRPEVAFGHITRSKFQGALSFGGSLGPYLDIGPMVVRVPFAVQGIYVIDSRSGDAAALVAITGEAGIRF